MYFVSAKNVDYPLTYEWQNIIIFLIIIISILILGFILLVLGLRLSTKSFLDREKSRPFECGFNPNSVARLPFSLRFFLIAIVFLIFDIELVLVFPVVVSSSFVNPVIRILILLVFIVILILGLYYESNQGSLD